jgi:hypothetical protein
MPGHLTLKFATGSGTHVTRGPLAQIRLEGEVIRAEGGGPIIARHVDHAWLVDGVRYLRLDIDTDTTITAHFERIDGSLSKSYGPYETFSFVDGVAYANRAIFAFADRSIVDWYCHADGIHWPLLVIAANGPA